MSIIPLPLAKVGEEGEVVDVKGGWGILRRLESMGIRKGVRVKKLSSQPMRGPILVQAGNTKVAIGHGMARRIMIAIDQ